MLQNVGIRAFWICGYHVAAKTANAAMSQLWRQQGVAVGHRSHFRKLKSWFSPNACAKALHQDCSISKAEAIYGDEEL